MALEPRLRDDRSPHPRTVNEIFFLRRRGVDLELTWADGKVVTSGGRLFVTSLRLVFVPAAEEEGKGCDLPLLLMSEEEFVQPIFFCNYLKGVVQPLDGGGLSAPASFKLYFKEGAGTFLGVFFRVLGAVRQAELDAQAEEEEHAQAQLVQRLEDVRRAAPAFVDPSDPSVVFVVRDDEAEGDAAAP